MAAAQCPTCKGDGTMPGSPTKPCPTCKGMGHM